MLTNDIPTNLTNNISNIIDIGVNQDNSGFNYIFDSDENQSILDNIRLFNKKTQNLNDDVKNINHAIENATGFGSEYIIVILGLLLYYFNFLSEKKYLVTNIIITSFVLAVFDLFLKKIILFHINNDYYKFVVNNIITIVVIDLLFNIISNGLYNNEKLSFVNYFNLAFACFFYETIVYKLFNYNGLCNQRLRSLTKTIMRLATIHILSNFLNDKPYDSAWFEFSFGQLFNFALFNTVFSEN